MIDEFEMGLVTETLWRTRFIGWSKFPTRILSYQPCIMLFLTSGTQFHVNYIYLQFRSPRPHAMVIYKRFNDTSPWTPWAYFSSNCYTYFGMNYKRNQPLYTRPDEVTCKEDYSTLQPLYGGEVIFSVIKGRPGYDQFFTNEELQVKNSSITLERSFIWVWKELSQSQGITEHLWPP